MPVAVTGAIELVEDRAEFLRGDAAALVRHIDADILTQPACRDLDRRLLHGVLRRIVEEVHENALHQDEIDIHQGQFIFNIGIHFV